MVSSLMVVRLKLGWIRFAAVGVLSAWLPCLALGLCVRAPEAPSRHGCCPRQLAVKIGEAPQECWLQSPAPLPAGPPPAAHATPAAVVAHARPVAETPNPRDPRHPTFSPLAIVLRI